MRVALAFLFMLLGVAVGHSVSPTATSVAANALVIKAGAGHLYHIYAVNHTATAGYLIVLNATAAPADGTVAPLACSRLPANGVAEIAYTQVPASFSTGMVAVLTSAATCLTKTTGTITGFISALAE